MICLSHGRGTADKPNENKEKKTESKRVKTKQAKEDADTLIVETASENDAKSDSVLIIGEDIDLLVILTRSEDQLE